MLGLACHCLPHPGILMSEPPSLFRRTLVRVMAVQVVTLALLWLLQSRFAN